MLGLLLLPALALLLDVSAAPTYRSPVAAGVAPITLPLRVRPSQPPAERRRRSVERKPEPPIPGAGRFALSSFGTQYSITMDVGTPPQPLELMFDTGSPALWVMDECIVTEQCSMSQLFDSASSSTLQRSRESWGMSYGAGEVKGVVASDMVGLGDMRAKTVMGLVGHMSTWGFTASGIVGFGPASEYAIPPWWDGVLPTWPEKRFGFFVGRTADWDSRVPLQSLGMSVVPRAGSVTLGGVDPSLFDGDLRSTPSNLTKWWTVGLEGVNVGGESVDIAVGLESTAYGNVLGRPSAMLDTGFSWLLGPATAVKRVYAAIPGAIRVANDSFLVPSTTEFALEFCFAGGCWGATLVDRTTCRSRAELVEWIPEDIVQAEGQVQGVEWWCEGTLSADTTAGEEFPQWLLGDAFLQNHYIAHQFEPPQVQIAPLSRKARELVKSANIDINDQLGG